MDTPLESKKNKVSSFAHVHYNAIMGKGNEICEGAIIREGVIMGDNNYVGPYCIIGEMGESLNYIEKNTGKVVIGNNNRFFKQVTIDGGTAYKTILGNDCVLLKNSHVGHDAILHDNVRLSCNSSIGGHTIVGRRSSFGIGSVAHQRLQIPDDVFIGMNGVVVKKSKLHPGRVYAGLPVKDIGCNHYYKEVMEDSILVNKCIRCEKCVE